MRQNWYKKPLLVDAFSFQYIFLRGGGAEKKKKVAEMSFSRQHYSLATAGKRVQEFTPEQKNKV